MRRNAIEWGVLGASIAVILALVVFIAVDGLLNPEEQAELGVSALPARVVGETFVVPIEVKNEGDGPAENVDVEVVLLDGETEVDTGSVTLPFLAAHSEIEAAAVFAEDPRRHRVEARVLGYEIP
jgi:uncharacterized protein (TIGR02588 family)